MENFKKHLLSFIRSNSNNVFNINNQDFQDSVDPLCSCGNHIESTAHFFAHCANFTTQTQTYLNQIIVINVSILAKNENLVVKTLLFARIAVQLAMQLMQPLV